jgi:hypothetical protein
MTQHLSRRLIASLCIGFLLLSPAVADPTPAPSPEGGWTFISGKMTGGCVLSGDMVVTRKKDKTLSCDFRAKWACESRLPKLVQTEQTCTAKQSGADVVITSRMSKIGKVEPVELAEYMRANYAADHFKLKINTRGDEMRGLFHSYGQAEVIFRRHIELIG